jgi:DNA polymerase (family 10)
MRNKEVAAHLRLIAQMMTLDGANRFKVRAFEDAADAAEHSEADLEAVDPSTLSGIGPSTADVITEFLRTGSSSRARDLEGRLPGVTEALTMTVVDGVGAKTAWKLSQEKGIRNFDELASAAGRGELREKLATAVGFAKEKASGRVPRASAGIVARFVTEALTAPRAKSADGSHGLVSKVQVCGSFRRGRATSKDIDVVALASPGIGRAEVFAAFGQLGEVINVGDKKSSVWVTRHGVSMQVDLWLVDEWYWGSALHYATGSKDHVKDIRARARARGLTVNEYGVFEAGAEYVPENQLAGRTEESVYGFFGLEYPEPEGREEKARPAA